MLQEFLTNGVRATVTIDRDSLHRLAILMAIVGLIIVFGIGLMKGATK